jgi:hypothetical protein
VALHQAALESLETRLLMSVSPATISAATPTNPAKDKTDIQLTWSNGASDILETFVEVKEAGPTNNWFSMAELSGSHAADTSVTMTGFFKAASYQFRVRTLTTKGQAYSSAYTMTSDDNAFGEDTTVDESAGFSYTRTLSGVIVHWTDATGVSPPDRDFYIRMADSQFPDRWAKVGASLDTGSDGTLTLGHYGLQGSSSDIAETPSDGTLANVAGAIFSATRIWSLTNVPTISGTRSTADTITLTVTPGDTNPVEIFRLNSDDPTAIPSTSFSGIDGTTVHTMDRSDYFAAAAVDSLSSPTEGSAASAVLDLARAFQPRILQVQLELANPTSGTRGVPAAHIYWDNTAYNESGYKIERAVMNSSHTDPDWANATSFTLSADTSDFVDTGPAGGFKAAETYYYRLTAVRSGMTNLGSV